MAEPNTEYHFRRNGFAPTHRPLELAMYRPPPPTDPSDPVDFERSEATSFPLDRDVYVRVRRGLETSGRWEPPDANEGLLPDAPPET